MEFNEAIKQSKRWDDFQTWYQKDPYYKEVRGLSPSAYTFIAEYPFVFQQGVFLEYLREQGIEIVHSMAKTRDTNQQIIKAYGFSIGEMVCDVFIDAEPYIKNPDYQTGLKEAILRSFNL